MARPTSGSFHPIYQQGYIDAAVGETIQELIANHSEGIDAFYASIPLDKGDYAYAERKWTVKQLLQHVIDTERILTYRALCISRGEKAALPGFDEDSYAANATAIERNIEGLIEELLALRKSTNLLLLSFTEDQLEQVGNANGYSTTVNAICFIIFGHLLHHQQILKERYLC